MDVTARSCGQPLADFRMLVRCIVVEHEMNVDISMNGLVNPLQKPEKLLIPVSRLAVAKYGPFKNVQSGE